MPELDTKLPMRLDTPSIDISQLNREATAIKSSSPAAEKAELQQVL